MIYVYSQLILSGHGKFTQLSIKGDKMVIITNEETNILVDIH